MTTPNIEELIDRLYDWHNTSAEQNRLDMQKAADLMQSQAERIKELEGDVEYLQKDIDAMCNAIPSYRWSGGAAELIAKCFAERDTLRAELDAIEAQEPVAWMTPSGEGYMIRFTEPMTEVNMGWDKLYAAPRSTATSQTSAARACAVE